MRRSKGFRVYAMLLPAFALVAILVCAAAGCGGSDSGETTTSNGSTSARAEGGTDGTSGEGRSKNGSAGEAGAQSGAEQGVDPEAPLGGSGRSEYIIAADRVCAESRQQIGNEMAPFLSGPGNVNTLKKKAPEIAQKVLIPGLETEIAELKALGTPEGKDGKAGAEMAGALEAMLAEAKSSPVGLLVLAESTGDAEAVALTYGFRDCGRLA